MEETRTCPICDTTNPGDAIHCEVCGERLVPEEFDSAESADELSADGGEVVGFAVEDSGGDEAPVSMEIPEEAPDTLDVELEVVAEEEDLEAQPPAPPLPQESEADVTADSIDAESFAEADAPDVEEGTEAMADATSAATVSEAEAGDVALVTEEVEADEEFAGDDEEGGDEQEAESEPMDEEALQAEFDALEEEFGDEPSSDEPPEFLYSPMDGTAYPRGSEEYEDGFGPNGEELVATPPEGTSEGAASEADEEELEVAGLNEASGASMDDAELAAAAAPSAQVSAEFQRSFQAQPRERAQMAPLPEPGTYMDPAVLTVYANREPVMRLAVDMDEVLIGRRDPVADAYPDLDLSDLDPDAHISRKHAYIYRQNKNYTLYAVSNAGTQLNSDLLELGDRRALSHGDVIVLAGKIAMKFELPNN